MALLPSIVMSLFDVISTAPTTKIMWVVVEPRDASHAAWDDGQRFLRISPSWPDPSKPEAGISEAAKNLIKLPADLAEFRHIDALTPLLRVPRAHCVPVHDILKEVVENDDQDVIAIVERHELKRAMAGLLDLMNTAGNWKTT